LMMLYEEGRFQLDHPVAQYLPAFGRTKVLSQDGTLTHQSRPMQIRDLLTHTAGLTYDFMADNPAAQIYRDSQIMHDATRSLEATIDELATIPLAFQPGTRWHYSVSIDVVARLIEIISGQTLGDFLERRLLAPLGMRDTAFGVPESKLDRLSAMYGLPDLFGENYSGVQLMEAAEAGFNERIDVSATYPVDTPEVFTRGGIGLFSTAGDYLRFARMLANNGTLDGERLLGRKTLELMHSNHLAAELMPFELAGRLISGVGFGLGSRVILDPALAGASGSVGEYGWSGAAKTDYWVDPAEDLVGLFMSQYMTGVLQPERDMHVLTYQAIID
ncbi:MAG: serine hydrolase, partial [Actinomycetota bacterium]|nr:serine hydrolase [Actinomycetota bacterium]